VTSLDSFSFDDGEDVIEISLNECGAPSTAAIDTTTTTAAAAAVTTVVTDKDPKVRRGSGKK